MKIILQLMQKAIFISYLKPTFFKILFIIQVTNLRILKLMILEI